MLRKESARYISRNYITSRVIRLAIPHPARLDRASQRGFREGHARVQLSAVRFVPMNETKHGQDVVVPVQEKSVLIRSARARDTEAADKIH